jgi:hypothetical protein
LTVFFDFDPVPWSRLAGGFDLLPMITTNARLEDLDVVSIDAIDGYIIDESIHTHGFYRRQTEARMLQLHQYHTVCQEYVLPVPYLCQIYHLLNLKHLEVVHGFSLKGLKIGKVGGFEATETGGSIKFQTTLVSSFNLLRIWRQPVVEVELTLHNPYTIELNVGIYKNKKITVMFNVLPLGEREHKLGIDIYSNVGFAKPVLQILLHCAACLTLFEDLPYLHKLAQKSPNRLLKSAQRSQCQTMQLFNRFVDLYGANLDRSPSIAVQRPPSTETYDLAPSCS